MTLQARMQQVALTPVREPHTIVGSKEWLYTKNRGPNYNKEKEQERFFSTFTHEEKVEYFNTIPKAFCNAQKVKNGKFINNIIEEIYDNEWQYIEGGQHDGCWVHQAYPEQIFQGDVVTLECTQGPSDVEFPVSALEDDIHGIAYHCNVNNTGFKKEILPNKWHNYDSTRKGKRQKRNLTLFNRRLARWQSYEEAKHIKNPLQKQEVLAELRMKYHQEDVLRQQNKMGYTDKQIAAEEAFE